MIADCYGWVFMQAKKYLNKKIGQSIVFVHGEIRNPTTHEYFNHAYIIKRGKVYDWGTKAKDALSRKEFVFLFKPKNEQLYTALEILKNALKYRTMGPW